MPDKLNSEKLIRMQNAAIALVGLVTMHQNKSMHTEKLYIVHPIIGMWNMDSFKNDVEKDCRWNQKEENGLLWSYQYHQTQPNPTCIIKMENRMRGHTKNYVDGEHNRVVRIWICGGNKESKRQIIESDPAMDGS